MTEPPALTPEQFQRVARALADPTRLEIMRRIYASAEPVHCGAACNDLRVTAATSSHHFRELELAELIRVEKNGRFRLLTPRREVWESYLAMLRRL